MGSNDDRTDIARTSTSDIEQDASREVAPEAEELAEEFEAWLREGHWGEPDELASHWIVLPQKLSCRCSTSSES